ncbi:hypothetical protein [Nonomuraea sp. NPDC049709]|uniref:hypothetical protein n=1 Tax=Nonomuraea sp. NPDC049709 TaxID=3154736 RepID=UPI00341D47DF
MSAGIGHLVCGGPAILLQGIDDAVEVVQDLLVHLHHALVATGVSGGDDLQDLAALLVVLG